MHTYTCQGDIRDAFWDAFPSHWENEKKRKSITKGHNAKTAECRYDFCNFIDQLERNGEISEALAQNVTL
jgi:hypothetical protein